MILPAHDNYVTALDEMLQHLAALTDAAETALKQEAGHYEQTDLKTESRIDASYPEIPRLPATTD